jgi:hypothetical protein
MLSEEEEEGLIADTFNQQDLVGKEDSFLLLENKKQL